MIIKFSLKDFVEQQDTITLVELQKSIQQELEKRQNEVKRKKGDCLNSAAWNLFFIGRDQNCWDKFEGEFEQALEQAKVPDKIMNDWNCIKNAPLRDINKRTIVQFLTDIRDWANNSNFSHNLFSDTLVHFMGLEEFNKKFGWT